MGYPFHTIRIVLWLCLFGWMAPVATAQQRDTPDTMHRDAHGMSRIVITLNGDYGDEQLMPRTSIESRRMRIATDQATLIARLGPRVSTHRSFKTLPALALTVDQAGLEALQHDPLVAYIANDTLNRTTMAESRELIGSVASNHAGFGGQGMVVAVLDTGVQHRDQTTGELRPHKMLRGRVSAEACFSSHDPLGSYTSLCKNNHAEQTFVAGAAAPCADICAHGTHVAATIAGNVVAVRDLYSQVMRTHSGVAPLAKIVAIQVFTKFHTTNFCGQFAAPCLAAWDSDLIAALDWLYDNYNSPRFGGTLVAANMSLGGSWSTKFCDTSEMGRLYKQAIDNLRTRAVATVIAAANNGYVDRVSSPGCVSSAITVGATVTHNAPFGVPDRVATFSNSPTPANNAPNANDDRLLDLYAPGDQITSAIPTNSTSTRITEAYDTWSGTSMATPHVAGAWAVMRSAAPNATVPQVLNWLRQSGKQITNQRTNLTLPRIDLARAVTLAKNAGQTTRISTYAVEFGKVGRGQTLNRVITLHNQGTTATSVRISLNGTYFEHTQTCATQLDPQARCTITVRYAPTEHRHLTQHTGHLTVTLNRRTHTIGLSGSTVLFALSPPAHDFGKVPINVRKTLAQVRLFNYSTLPIVFSTYAYDTDGNGPQMMDTFEHPHPYSQYPGWNTAINNWEATILPGNSAVVIQNLVFKPTYGHLPTHLGIQPGYYTCYPDATNPRYGSCINRPGMIYIVIDSNATDRINCGESPYDLSCRWLRFPFNGTAKP